MLKAQVEEPAVEVVEEPELPVEDSEEIEVLIEEGSGVEEIEDLDVIEEVSEIEEVPPPEDAISKSSIEAQPPEVSEEIVGKGSEDNPEITQQGTSLSSEVVKETPRHVELKHPNIADDEALREYQEVFKLVVKRAESAVFKGKELDIKTLSDDEWSYYSDRVLQIVETMRRNNELPKGIDTYVLSQDVLTEYAGFGAIDPLINDESIRSIQVVGCLKIFVLRGRKWERVQRVFSSVSALRKVIARLLKEARVKETVGQRYIKGRLEEGILLQVLLPPLSQYHTVILERKKTPTLNIQDLISARVITQEVIDKIQDKFKEPHSIMIVGPKNSGKKVLLNALLSLIPADARLVVITGKEDLKPPQINTLSLNKEQLFLEKRSVSLILQEVDPDWVVFSSIDSSDIRTWVELSATGRYGLIGSFAAPDGDKAFDRWRLRLAIEFPTLSEDNREKILYNSINMMIILQWIQGVGSRVTDVLTLGIDSQGLHKESILEKSDVE